MINKKTIAFILMAPIFLSMISLLLLIFFSPLLIAYQSSAPLSVWFFFVSLYIGFFGLILYISNGER